MNLVWTLLGAALLVGVVAAFARSGRAAGGRAPVKAGDMKPDEEFSPGNTDPGSKWDQEQLGVPTSSVWPDRTGPQTRRELGGREATDVTFTGERIKPKDGMTPTPAVGRQAPAGHTHVASAPADQAAEDTMGEDRPAARTTAPGQPPTQWHPADHGAPGVHIRDGHDRFATAPKTRETDGDPLGHAPVPGPNHWPTEAGQPYESGDQP